MVADLVWKYLGDVKQYIDPFCGSGTTCMAAKRLGRDYIGIDLEADHVQIAECRVAAVKLEEETLFAEAQ